MPFCSRGPRGNTSAGADLRGIRVAEDTQLNEVSQGREQSGNADGREYPEGLAPAGTPALTPVPARSSSPSWITGTYTARYCPA